MYPSATAPERWADGLVHAVSLAGFLVASGFLLHMVASGGETPLLIATIVYILGAVASISISFAYHLSPRHDLREALRRWDHAAIYAIIAGTFSPLLILCATWSAHLILAIIWVLAVIGIVFKLFARSIDARWSLASYLGLGWFALVALPDFWASLPGFSTAAIAAGGVFYTIGTVFYRSKTTRFRYAIWHAFGTLGGGSFLVAIWTATAAQLA